MKRYLPFVAILVLTMATCAVGQRAKGTGGKGRRHPATLQAQLVQMETALWDAWKNKDPKPFKTHLSSDSVMVGDVGVSVGGNVAEDLKACDVRSFGLSDWKLKQLDADAALLTYKAAQDGTCGGQTLPPAVWASTMWVKQKGVWRAAFHQETPAK